MSNLAATPGPRGWARAGGIRRCVREHPYPTLALWLAVGYVAGGGLFSSFTRPFARAATGAMLVPTFRARVRDLADEIRETMGFSTGAASTRRNHEKEDRP